MTELRTDFLYFCIVCRIGRYRRRKWKCLQVAIKSHLSVQIYKGADIDFMLGLAMLELAGC